MKPQNHLPSEKQPEQPLASPKMSIHIRVNGMDCVHEVEATQTLSQFLRETTGLTGLKEGCGEGECGACTILVDNRPVNSCLMLAFQAHGRDITTIEGLESDDGTLSALQQAFIDHGAVQCGYCTPGMVMAGEGLLRENGNPDETEIRHALAGNICRCTGFINIVKAIKSVASTDSVQAGK